MNRPRIFGQLDEPTDAYYKQVCECRQDLATAYLHLPKHQELLELHEARYAAEHVKSQRYLQQIKSTEIVIRGLEVVLAKHKAMLITDTEKYDSAEKVKHTALRKIQITKDELAEPERIQARLLQTIPYLEVQLNELKELRAALKESTPPPPSGSIDIPDNEAVGHPTPPPDTVDIPGIEAVIDQPAPPSSFAAIETITTLLSPTPNSSQDPPMCGTLVREPPNGHEASARWSLSQEMELDSASDADIQYDPSAEDDPNNEGYTLSHQNTSVTRACIRCNKRAFWCARSDSQADRPCVQCERDSMRCSFVYLNTTGSRKRVSKEDSDKLADLIMNKGLTYKEIHELRVLGDIKIDAIRKRWEKSKSFYTRGHATASGSVNSCSPSEHRASERAVWSCYESESD